MSSFRRPAVLAAAVACVAVLAAPAGAGAAQKYRFRFATTLHMDWQWPPNAANGGQRAAQAFEVLGGRGCGTRPGRAVWRIRFQTPGSGLSPSTQKLDLIRRPRNPARIVDARYYVPPTADVQGFLTFARTQVTLSAVPHGDVAGLEVGPQTATISRARVKRC